MSTQTTRQGRLITTAFALTVGAGLACPAAVAQDSVAATPGGNDAIASSDLNGQQVRYVLDLAQATSSWGSELRVGPLSKSARDVNPLFPTQIVGSTAVSPIDLANLTLPGPTDFQSWSTAGAGVNQNQNNPASSVSVAAFDRAFAAAFGDFSGTATNAFTLEIGQNADDPSRLYVTRTMALTGRAGAVDTASVSVGGVDASGGVVIRADDFNTNATSTITGENIIRVQPALRNTSSTNIAIGSGGSNFITDAAASSALVDAGQTTLNIPTVLDATGATPSALIYDFAGGFSVDGGSATTAHLDPANDAIRGNPSFHAAATAPTAVGTIASIARNAPAGSVASLNFAQIDASGSVVQTDAATLPSPISTSGFSANAGGDAEFAQFRSQTSFRGPAGQVAVANVGGTLIAAATATDPAEGDFIAVVELAGSPAWAIAAFPGQDVLDGPGGNPIGTLANAAPASISAPAIDSDGNIYFTAAFNPNVGASATGLFRAVPIGGAYELELLVREGLQLTGDNSQTPYTITDITLADSDSVASGSFHAGALIPAANSLDANQPFGGAVISASIEYNRSGVLEPYNAVLFVGADLDIADCPGDVTGDGQTTALDISRVLSNFGQTTTDGDANGDGVVTALDISAVLGDFGCAP